MDVSAVILSFNSQRYIQNCIRSLQASLREVGLSGEIFVIDNGSRDGCVQTLQRLQQELGAQLHVDYLPRNTGTTYSRNLALRRARAAHVLVLDSDAYMNGAALRALVDYQDRHPCVGLVAPKLIYPDGRFQLSVDVFPTLMRKFERFVALRELEARQSPVAAGAVDYAISAVWLISRRALQDTGLLDQRIFYSPEDVDFCIRMWSAGHQVHYLPDVSVVHDAQELSRPKGFAGINLFTIRHAKGLAYLFLKHRYAFGLQRLYRRIGRLSAVVSEHHRP